MTYRYRHAVECDQCGAEVMVHGVSRRKALKLFARSGWDIGKGNIADLCPPCRRMDELDDDDPTSTDRPDETRTA